MFKQLFKPLLLLIFLGLAQQTLAKEYQIELIIFEHIYDSSTPEATSRVDMASTNARLRNMRPTTPENLVLTEEAKRIRGSRNFRYISHASWIQEGLDRESSGFVTLDGWTAKNGISGKATVYLNRYLHLDIQLAKNDIYFLKQKRRMRSKELHYIDHPKFGVLAQITPIDD